MNPSEVAVLCQIGTPDLAEELFETARAVKEQIYGHRMVLFAPLYISNVCSNDCTYCAFRSTNKALPRTALDMAGIQRDTLELVRQGHKRLLMVAGEGYSAAKGGFQYVLDAIHAVYDVTEAHGHIRRLNVNLAPLGSISNKNGGFRWTGAWSVSDAGSGHGWTAQTNGVAVLPPIAGESHAEFTIGGGDRFGGPVMNGFEGYIDEVKVWAAALTPQAVFNGYRSADRGKVGGYTLGEDAVPGTTAGILQLPVSQALTEEHAPDERYAPAVGVDLLDRQHHVHEPRGAGPEDEADGRAGGRGAAHQAANER